MKVTVSVTNDLVTDQRVHKVCQSLTKEGYEINLVGRILPDSKPINRAYKTHRMRLLFRKSFLFYAEYNIRLFFYLLFTKTDILLSNDTDSLAANYLVSRIRKKKIIFDAHEMFPEVPEVVNRPFVKKVWTKIEDWIFPKLKNSYTVCQSIADIYNERYNMSMQVIRNIPFADKKQTNPAPIQKGDKKVILYQGAVNVGRGIEWIIDTMPYLDDFVFYVIGDGDLLESLKEKVQAQNLSDKVIFMGKIPFEELPAYTDLADIGVNLLKNQGLNYYYSLPNRIFDYIRREIPVLATDFPEVRRIVSHYDLGILVDNYEPQFLADKIIELSNKEKNEAGFALANEELTWEKEEKTLLRMVENV